MTDTRRDGSELLPELDGGPGPALPLDRNKMRAMIGAAITGGLGPGGGDGPAGAGGGELAATSSNAVLVKAGLIALGLGAATVAAVMLTGAYDRDPLVSPTLAAQPAATTTPAPRAAATPPMSSPTSQEPATRAPQPGAPISSAAPVRSTPRPRQVAKRRTPDDLLRRANDARKQRAWTAADALYRKVWKTHPGTRAAYVAAVASAQLNLGKLDKPAIALRLFQRALRQDGAGFLTEEARFGVARSLRKLGNVAAETAALRQFLRAHSGSALAPRARARLDALVRDAAP